MKTTNVHPKILNCIERMICDFDLNYQFYGEFCNYINFHRNNDPVQMPTMGVNVSKAGMNFHFNDSFLDPLPQEQVNWGVIHELLHLLYNHPSRSVNYDHRMANVAQDMIINWIIDTDFNQKFAQRIPNCLELPKEYEKLVKEDEKKLYFEDLYEWLADKREEYEQEKKENGGGQGDNGQGDESEGQGGGGQGESSDESGRGGQGSEGETGEGTAPGSGTGRPANAPDANGNYPNGAKSKVEKGLRDLFDSMDQNGNGELTVDKHMQNEVDNDYAKEVVAQVADGLKARGLGKGNVESVLNKIQRRKKDYLKEIKRSISNLKGSSLYKTINRPNIFSLEGAKGKKRTGKGLNVILDTSGSMGGSFEKILSYVFQRNIVINLIQVDTDVQSYITLSDMKDFKNLKISGYGGTMLQPGIEYIKTKKELSGFNLLVLTDGYTDTLNFNDLPGCKKVLIISNGTKTPISKENRASVKEIIVER